MNCGQRLYLFQKLLCFNETKWSKRQVFYTSPSAKAHEVASLRIHPAYMTNLSMHTLTRKMDTHLGVYGSAKQ